MPQHRNVFISSTEKDLADYRKAVREVITTLGFFPSGMETWPVGDENSVDRCKRMVEDAEIYVGIYAQRYGWCPPGYNGKSITELEYDWATAKSIPRLCFVMKNDYAWPEDKKELDATEKLDAFKARVTTNFIGFFTTPDDLGKQVAIALAALPAQLTVDCNFVPEPHHFVGRSAELEALNKAFSDTKPVAITAVKGIGGIGKSTLAKAFARDDKHFNLKLWAEVGQVAGEKLLRDIFDSWTGQKFPPEMQLPDIIHETQMILTKRAQSCGGSVLVIIDDVWMETVAQARKLLDAVPMNTKVLITTRSEEVRMALGCKLQSLDAMTPEDGATLILVLIDHEQAETYRPELEELSRTLAGHPLALSLAARQIALNPQQSWINELVETFKRGIKDGDEFSKLELDESEQKVDSVRVSLKLTYDKLGGKDEAIHERRQQQFRTLGALPLDLGFRADHVWMLWHEKDSRALAELIGEGLLDRVKGREGWYIQHRLLRAYARALLRQHRELDEVEQRHRDYLTKLAHDTFNFKPLETWMEIGDDLPQIHALGNDLTAQLGGTDNPNLLDERLRLMSAQELTSEILEKNTSLLQDTENFAEAVFRYIILLYIGAEGRRWLWAGLITAYSNKHENSIYMFANQLGQWYDQRRDAKMALVYYKQAFAAAQAAGNKSSEATVLHNIGETWRKLGETQRALDYLSQALPLRRAVGDKAGEAATLNTIGSAWYDIRDYQQALLFYNKALPICHEIGDKRDEAITLNNLGTVWHQLGKKDKALGFYRKSLPLRRETGDKRGEATTLGNMAQILWEQGRQTAALEQMQISRDLCISIGLSTEIQDKWLKLWRRGS